MLKQLFPDRRLPMRVLFGPFRGARVAMNPRVSMRKVFGIYEHELNGWLRTALPKTRRVLDVGANDGYFTFGCAAALRRLKRKTEILAFEPQLNHVEDLQQGIELQRSDLISIQIVPKLVGDQLSDETVTLDSLETADHESTLIKIDVEGAEEIVLRGSERWLNASNMFLIEVHRSEFLITIPQLFAAHGLKLNEVPQQPHWLLGAEQREASNCWLVSDLNSRK